MILDEHGNEIGKDKYGNSVIIDKSKVDKFKLEMAYTDLDIITTHTKALSSHLNRASFMVHDEYRIAILEEIASLNRILIDIHRLMISLTTFSECKILPFEKQKG